MKHIFEEVRDKLTSHIQTSLWLHPQTKANAVNKIRQLKGEFVGSDIYFNQTLLRERYKAVRSWVFLFFFLKKGIFLEKKDFYIYTVSVLSVLTTRLGVATKQQPEQK